MGIVTYGSRKEDKPESQKKQKWEKKKFKLLQWSLCISTVMNQLVKDVMDRDSMPVSLFSSIKKSISHCICVWVHTHIFIFLSSPAVI